MPNPRWMNALAVLVVLSGIVALTTSNVVSWIVFSTLAFVAGILLIIVDRKQRSQ